MYWKAVSSMLLAVALTLIGGGAIPVAAEDTPAQAPELLAVTTGTVFTYQGQLNDNGTPASGSFDFEFKLFDAAGGGTQVGTTQNTHAVAVSQGVFTTALDFGAAFDGQARWLEIAVRPAGGGGYTLLVPRQALTATPYALGLVPGVLVSGGVAGSTLMAVNTSNNNIALRGEANGLGGVGVWGQSNANTGVYGLTTGGKGVWGESTADLGTGVYGKSNGGKGVEGLSTQNIGVYGESTNWVGVWGESVAWSGVVGNSSSGSGVLGQSQTGAGVLGHALAASGESNGVFGQSDSSVGNGVRGIAASTSGPAWGVWGHSESADGVGVRGSGAGHGVWGSSQSSSRYAVFGTHQETNSVAVKGRADSLGAVGVWGESAANTGVYGISGNANGRGVWGANTAGGWAGYFDGKVHVQGTLTKSAGSFQIDHPLDPANQYLSHSFVESPDMKNLYDGVAVLDGNGAAVVSLPDWFAALNGGEEFQGDFRYQLTPIGAAMPNLHIAEEIAGNTFRIAGGMPGMKVSWLLTGIRHDPYAESARIAVEQRKPDGEQGTYLHPELYGQPASLALGHGRVPPQGERSAEQISERR